MAKQGQLVGHQEECCFVRPCLHVWVVGGESNRVMGWAASRAENGVEVGRRGVRQRPQGVGHMSIRVG